MLTIDVPKWVLALLNNIYDLECKIHTHGDLCNASRNLTKMKDALAGEGLFYEDPMGQCFKETRTDLDASISGIGTENLVVIEVIKPIIRHGTPEFSRVVQKGIVLVKSKDEVN
ncbi:MAG: hypothetical protein JZU59_10575 [Chromatium okenii]|nr:hypothetical protein [Chromatium okenii]